MPKPNKPNAGCATQPNPATTSTPPSTVTCALTAGRTLSPSTTSSPTPSTLCATQNQESSPTTTESSPPVTTAKIRSSTYCKHIAIKLGVPLDVVRSSIQYHNHLVAQALLDGKSVTISNLGTLITLPVPQRVSLDGTVRRKSRRIKLNTNQRLQKLLREKARR